MQRRQEFSFPGSPARGLLPPRPAASPRYGEEEVRWLQASRQASPEYSSGGSGTPSPQLWAYHPDHQKHHNHPRQYPASGGSSPSRAQAIAGYRREMLDLVRCLPESAYELSLRDIVEHPAISSSPSPPPDPLPQPSNAGARQQHTDAFAGAQQQHVDGPAAAATQNDEPAGAKKDAVAAAATAAVVEGKKQSSSSKKLWRKQRTLRKQRSRSRSLERSVSLDTGLLIKLFLPLSISGKKKVSPKPDAGKNSSQKDKERKKQGKKEAAAQEEWWTKSECSEAGSSSRTSSTGSSNSSAGSIRNVNGSSNPRAPARSWSRKRTGCYAFFRANKGKNGVGQD